MRVPRIKAAEGRDGLYHCMSRIVGGEFLLGEKEKEMFVRMMWRVAAFLGIEILDYVVMNNHYHQLLRVPGKIDQGDDELFGRIKAYHGEESLEVVLFEKAREEGGETFSALRARYVKRMGDVSEYEKILKQGFSAWFNKRNKRRGTLWMERFKSVLVEDTVEMRRILSTYISLNPVRAELVSDPKNYRHCGYTAAVAGDQRCRAGIMGVMGLTNWKRAAAAYRMNLMRRGQKSVAGKAGVINRELLMETLKEEGHLPQAELLRLKVRYFSDGLVLGSELFVEGVFDQYRCHFGEKRKSGARLLRGLSGSSWHTLRDLRLNPIS